MPGTDIRSDAAPVAGTVTIDEARVGPGGPVLGFLALSNGVLIRAAATTNCP